MCRRNPSLAASSLAGVFLAAMVGLGCGTAEAADWPRFRGPNGSGVAAGEAVSVPSVWGPQENLKWKVALPGPGSSCPIIVGEKVFVTCWTGYGTGRGDAGTQADLQRHLLCLDRASGKTLWDSAVKAVLPEDDYRGMFAEHGYASHTPACDGERVYAFFGKSGVVAFDMDGKQLWQTPVGSGLDPRGWGSACSPVLYQNLVIITAAAESETLYGLDKQTGKIVWKKEAGGIRSTWGTPVLVQVDDDRTDLVLGVPYEIWGLNPNTGGLRWFCNAMENDSYCSSVVSDGKVVYGVEGRGGGSIAVRAGGEDDVTDSQVVWTGRDNGRIGTPVVDDGRLYFISNKIANCVDAATGDRIYQARLESAGDDSDGGGRRSGRGGSDYASPVAADGKLFYVTRGGEMFVIALGPTFKQLAVNRVTADREDFSATPAISNGALFIRSDKHLYCIATTK